MIAVFFYDSRSNLGYNCFDFESQETFKKKHPDIQMCLETTSRYHETLSRMEREVLADLTLKHHPESYKATDTSWYRMLLVPIPEGFQTTNQIMMFMESIAFQNNFPKNGTWMNYYLGLNKK